MRPGRQAGRAGVALLPVVLALALLGATAYLMARESALGGSLASATQQRDRARYLAEAALRRADWRVQRADCSGFSNVATTSFADGSYDATVTPSSGSPVTLSATGILADGTTHTIDRTGVAAYETPSTLVLELGTDPGRDTIIENFYQRNYGGAGYLKLSADPGWIQHALLDFDVSGISMQAKILSAKLQLRMWSVDSAGSATAHRVTRDWVEGTQNGGGQADGATWQTHDGANAWSDPGGDFAAAPLAETSIQPGDTWVTWEIAPLVQQWVDGAPNHGLLLAGAAGLDVAEFASRETNNPADRPKLTIVYACECGMICSAAPGPSNNVLFVVGNDTNLSAEETAHQSLLELWGYTVEFIDDDATEAEFDAAAANNDVAFMTNGITASRLGTKLVNATIGVVTSEDNLSDEFGLSSSIAWGSGDYVGITDNTHYITSPFAEVKLTILSTSESLAYLTGTLSPDLGLLALAATGNGVVTLEAGATTYDGGTAAGRRVQLPWGGNGFDPNHLTADGLTILQRALEWAADTSDTYAVLMVVTDPGSLTPAAADRRALMESWGYTVTVIDDSADQVKFDTDIAAVDVVFVGSGSVGATIGTKLDSTTKGVVNEPASMASTLGFASSFTAAFGVDELTIVDSTHFITQGLASPVTVFTTLAVPAVLSGTLAPDLQNLAEALGAPALAVLESGATTHDAGTTSGRRAQLPFAGALGGDLTADGQLIVRRAIEWAAVAASVNRLLFVVTDAANPSTDEIARQTLVESWGYIVTRISDEDSQANFDAAASVNDLAYISGDALYNNVGIKLAAATIGVAFESYQLHNEFGMSPGSIALANLQSITITDSSHYITSPYTGSVNVTTSNTQLSAVSSFAPDTQLQLLASIPGYNGALATFDTGDVDHYGATVAGRRVKLPWGSTDWGFDFSSLSVDGQNILKRSLEWVAGAGGGGPPTGGVVFEEFAEVNPSTTYGVDVPTPGGTVEGDLLIAAIASDEDATDLAAPPGWTLIALEAHTTRATLGVWWKIAAASEPATHTFTSSRYEMKYGWMMRFSGHDPANPIHSTSSFETGSSRDPTAPSTTTTVDDTLILRIGGFDHQDITLDDPGLAGHTPITMDLGGSGLGACAGGAGYSYLPVAGAAGTVDFALTAKEEYVTGTIAIAPDPY